MENRAAHRGAHSFSTFLCVFSHFWGAKVSKMQLFSSNTEQKALKIFHLTFLLYFLAFGLYCKVQSK